MSDQRFDRLKAAAADVWRRLAEAVAAALATARPHVRRAAVAGVAFARGPGKRALLVALETIAALVVLFLEWGWKPLESALASLSRFLVFARLEAWIRSLPPYGALALFAAPAVLIFPIKLFALYLLTTGHPIAFILILGAAKVAGTAVVAHIFVLTQPQLMQISWFRWAYGVFMPWKEAMFERIRASAAWRYGRAVRVAAKRAFNRAWIGSRPWRTRALEAAHAAIAQARVVLRGFARDLRRTQR